MAPLVYYKCSKCKSTFGTYEAAEKCEASHFSVVSVRETEYKYGAYPFRVVLIFPDGAELDYIIDDGSYWESGVNHANDKNKKNSQGCENT